MTNIMQGGAYSIPINITADGTVIDSTMVDAVEVMRGFVVSDDPDAYPSAGNGEDGLYYVQLGAL